MTNIFFTSDTHFGHANFLNFRDADEKPIRSFGSVEEMDELMVQRWNEVVRDGDRVYHLGDVCWNAGAVDRIMPRLRGSKRLILGNHDDIREHQLLNHFRKITLWRLFKEEGFVCTHIPLPVGELRKASFNVHGHIHEKVMPSMRHINICVEQTDYYPVPLEVLKNEIAFRRGRLGE
jgi:calcineurin-like phosphoesterase family protein